MRPPALLSILCVGLSLAACQSTSPYVGSWSYRENESEGYDVEIRHDHTLLIYHVQDDSRINGMGAGTWAEDENDRIMILIESEPDEPGIGILRDPDTLVITAGNDGYEFTRQPQTP